ncbi:MAG: hypothetical protein Q9165_002540 [Trypethelium subeluteriae]
MLFALVALILFVPAGYAGAIPASDERLPSNQDDLNSTIRERLEDSNFLQMESWISPELRVCVKDENDAEPPSRFGLHCTYEDQLDDNRNSIGWDYDEKEFQAAARDATHYLREGKRAYGVNLEHLVEIVPMHWHTWFGHGSTNERKSRDLAHLKHVPALCRNAYLYFYPIQRSHTACGRGQPFMTAKAILTWDRVIVASSHRHDEPDFLLGKADLKACTIMNTKANSNTGEYCHPFETARAERSSEHESELKR